MPETVTYYRYYTSQDGQHVSNPSASKANNISNVIYVKWSPSVHVCDRALTLNCNQSSPVNHEIFPPSIASSIQLKTETTFGKSFF